MFHSLLNTVQLIIFHSNINFAFNIYYNFFNQFVSVMKYFILVITVTYILIWGLLLNFLYVLIRINTPEEFIERYWISCTYKFLCFYLQIINVKYIYLSRYKPILRENTHDIEIWKICFKLNIFYSLLLSLLLLSINCFDRSNGKSGLVKSCCLASVDFWLRRILSYLNIILVD